MKKLVLSTLVILGLFASEKMNAQYSIPGTFSSIYTGNGYYNLSCTGGGYCGMIGRQNPNGSYIFRASNNTVWDVYYTFSTSPTLGHWTGVFAAGVMATPN